MLCSGWEGKVKETNKQIVWTRIFFDPQENKAFDGCSARYNVHFNAVELVRDGKTAGRFNFDKILGYCEEHPIL